MPRIIRSGRSTDRLRGPADDDLADVCPVCQARKGWRCTWTLGNGDVRPRKTIHPERKRGTK